MDRSWRKTNKLTLNYEENIYLPSAQPNPKSSSWAAGNESFSNSTQLQEEEEKVRYKSLGGTTSVTFAALLVLGICNNNHNKKDKSWCIIVPKPTQPRDPPLHMACGNEFLYL